MNLISAECLSKVSDSIFASNFCSNMTHLIGKNLEIVDNSYGTEAFHRTWTAEREKKTQWLGPTIPTTKHTLKAVLGYVDCVDVLLCRVNVLTLTLRGDMLWYSKDYDEISALQRLWRNFNLQIFSIDLIDVAVCFLSFLILLYVNSLHPKCVLCVCRSSYGSCEEFETTKKHK